VRVFAESRDRKRAARKVIPPRSSVASPRQAIASLQSSNR
jgi:hypothetical protein